jgi:glycosyltransferase involved in cell wall biosynthesis
MTRVSVVLPVKDQAEYLRDAIESVLRQTLADWELIVVDDGSTDDSAAVVRRLRDDRIRYVFQEWQGVSTARNAGIALASGVYVAFLDADDRYHPGKLEDQISRFARDPGVGAVYCARIDVDRQGQHLRLHRPAPTASIEALLLARVGAFAPALVENEDRDLFVRLALAGCRFAGSDRFHSYRRRYEHKFFGDLPRVAADRHAVLDAAFADPRCPRRVRARRREAYRRTYVECALRACVQQEAGLARSFFDQVHRFSPWLRRDGDDLVGRFVEFATRPGGDHEPRLRSIFAQLPPSLARLRARCDAAVGRGYLLLGAADMIWGRVEAGHERLVRAASFGIVPDRPFRSWLAHQLDSHRIACGPEENARVRGLISEAGLDGERAATC